MKINIIKMSLVAGMLIGSSAYAGKIIGANAGDPYTADPLAPIQYGFGGWVLPGAVTVNITNLAYEPISKIFNLETGEYDPMEVGDTFESELWQGNFVRGLLHGKNWPVGEPAGIKIINNDFDTKNGKPENCIIGTSYLSAEDNGGVNGYLDAAYDDNESTIPVPVICSSPFQTHKRFKINMLDTTLDTYDTTTGYGDPSEAIILAFDLNTTDTSVQRYQVFQKINNYTQKRLDGYKIEVLDGNRIPDENLTLSIGLGENPQGQDSTNSDDIWDVEDMANFSHGLWGPADQHFPTDGFFDSIRAGFEVNATGHGTSTLEGGPTTLGSNYEALFGIWLPSKWAPKGIFFDHDNDPTTDAELVAFWGTAPDAPEGTLPEWHKGQADNWAVPTIEELLTWYTDPLYDMDVIEDTLNLGLNYIINIGDNTQIANNRVIVRITPRVAPDEKQTPPSYVDGSGNYIMPPTDYNGTDPVLIISPAPLFNLNADLSVGVADPAPNTNSGLIETVEIVITTTSGDEENLTLTETDVNSSIFVGTIGSDTNAVVVQDGNVSVVNGTEVTATYGALTETTTATDGTTPPVVINPSSGGGGCTYNPNSKNFDMTFLLMMALGLLYPFRRRFLK